MFWKGGCDIYIALSCIVQIIHPSFNLTYKHVNIYNPASIIKINNRKISMMYTLDALTNNQHYECWQITKELNKVV